MITLHHQVFGSNKSAKYGYQFVYSTKKILEISTLAVVRNNLNELKDIGSINNSINVNDITTFANGQPARYAALLDQNKKLPNVNSNNNEVLEPLATDINNIGVDYVRDTEQNSGLVLRGDYPLAMSNDYIVNYVFRNETQVNSQRTNFIIKTNTLNNEGLLILSVYPSGGNYIIGVKCKYNNANVQASDYTYSIPIGDVSKFKLFTFFKNGSNFIFYVNGVVIEPNGTNGYMVGGINISGIFIGAGYSSNGTLGQGKINDFMTLSLYTGADLSTFDINNYINTYKTIHNIL